MLKALVVLLYYERPRMVRRALASWAEAAERHHATTLVVNDDASPTPVEPIVNAVLGPLVDQGMVTVRRNETTPAQKAASGGMVGLAVNRAIAASDADFVVLLCDDDMLHPDALANLSSYFERNPQVMSCYGNVLRYDPTVPGSELEASLEGFPVPLNSHTEPINGCCVVDASQVAWRRACCVERGCWMDYPRTRDIDAHFFNELYTRCGPTHYAGCITQYKGVHDRQLGVVGLDRAWTLGGLDSDG